MVAQGVKARGSRAALGTRGKIPAPSSAPTAAAQTLWKRCEGTEVSPKIQRFHSNPPGQVFWKILGFAPSLLPAGVRVPEDFGWKGSGDELNYPNS